LTPRAYADAGPSVRHAERAEGAEHQEFTKDADSDVESEKSVEASSGEEDGGEEEGGGDDGKKKKVRSGFRDRKVINRQ